MYPRLHPIETLMEVFARIYSKNTGINIRFGSNFSTDGKDITIIRLLDDTDPAIRFEVEMGVMHEIGHIMTGDFPFFFEYLENNGTKKTTKSTIFNVVRDVTIEGNTMEVKYPGLKQKWKKFLTWLIEKQKPALASGNVRIFKMLMLATYFRAREYQHQDTFGEGIILPDAAEEIYQRRILPFIPDIAAHDTIPQSQELTETIFAELMKEPPPPKPPEPEEPDSEPQAGSGEESESGEEGESEPQTGDTGEDDPWEEKEEEKECENPTPTKSEDDSEEEEGKENEDEEPAPAEDGEDSEDKDEDPEDEEEGSNSASNEEDSEEKDESKEDSDSSEDDEKDEESDNENESDSDDEENSEDDSDEENDSDDEENSEGNENSEDDSDEENEGSEGEGEQSGSEETGEDEESEDPFSDDGEEALKKAQEEMEEDEGEKDIGEEIAEDVNKYADDTCLYRELPFMKENVTIPQERPGWNAEVGALEAEGRRITGYTGSKLKQLFISQQAPDWHRNLREGKLDCKNIWKAKVGKKEICKRRTPSTLEDSAVTMVVDNSGSMAARISGRNYVHSSGPGSKAFITHAIMTSLGSDMDKLRIPFEGIGFTTPWTDPSNHNAVNGVRTTPININLMKSFDEPYRQVRHRFVWPAYNNATAELPAIVFAANRLIVRKETKKVMFILTDGHTETGCSQLDAAMRVATKEFIERMKRAGIRVVLIGILDNSVLDYDPDAIILYDLNVFAREFYGKLMSLLL